MGVPLRGLQEQQRTYSFLGPTGTTTNTTMPKKANIFDSFSHSAIQQFKEAFGIMDADKDGLLSSSDLVAAFGAYGKNIGGGEAQAMLDEVDGPMNFTQMVTLFASKMAGGSDDDDVILASFEAFEMDGKICRRLQALPHDLRCQVLRQRSRRRLRGDEDRRGYDRRRPPEGPDGVKVNIFGCLLIKASRTELPGRHIRKRKPPTHDPATGPALLWRPTFIL